MLFCRTWNICLAREHCDFLTLACVLGGVVLQLLALAKAERARGRQRAAAEAEARHVHEDETDYGNL